MGFVVVAFIFGFLLLFGGLYFLLAFPCFAFSQRTVHSCLLLDCCAVQHALSVDLPATFPSPHKKIR